MREGAVDRRLDPATPSNPRGANRFRTRSLHVAAWGLAASAVPQSAAAAIISDIAVNQSPNSSFSFNGTTPEGDLDLVSMTGAMGFDLKLEAPGGMNPSTVELAISPSGGDDWLSLLGLGDTVDGSLTFGGSGFLVRHDTDSPVWAAGTTGYAGFTFNPDGTPLYGWIQVEFDLSGTDFTVLQWAYDDTGAPIAAGQMPEPSTAILLGLGLAGLAAVVRKRRRGRLPARHRLIPHP